ncbi:MAG: hypothetical protein WD669_13280 [Pirellulales bacterium]
MIDILTMIVTALGAAGLLLGLFGQWSEGLIAGSILLGSALIAIAIQSTKGGSPGKE